jgi:hypothetical protein
MTLIRNVHAVNIHVFYAQIEKRRKKQKKEEGYLTYNILLKA